MIILLLKGYNNYFNRIVKKEDSITAYKEASTSYLEYPDVNFDPNDGVITSLVVGGPTQKLDTVQVLDFEDSGSPDYLIAYVNTTNDGPIIKSRWFITECDRVRNGQYKLSLKRDSLVDYFDDIKSAPCYVEKATITDVNNPLLYNKEGLAVNQIKTAEHLLKDNSGVAWIVGYVSQKMMSETIDSNFGTKQLNSSGQASSTFYFDNANTISRMWLTNLDGSTTYAVGNSGDGKFTYSINSSTKYITYNINLPAQANSTVAVRFTYRLGTTVENGSYSVDLAGDDVRAHVEDAPYDIFCIPFGEILLNSANITTSKESALAIALGMSGDLGSFLYDIQLLPYCPRMDLIGANKIYEILGSEDIDYSYIKQGNTIKNILIWCKKSTFSNYAFPDTDILIDRPVDSTTKTKTISSTNARCITNTSGYSSVYITDNSIKGLTNVTVTGVSVSKGSYNAASTGINDFSYNDGINCIIMGQIYTPDFPWGTSEGWTASITFTYNEYEYPEYLDRKVSNECDLYRLVSPNYNGQFEWSIAKSSGNANVFDIDCTYKPFQPYIHVQPRFTNLYGSDFDDARGLICGGDFSLPIISDAWTQYQIQNKTYQEMFDRQINHMDTQHMLNDSSMGLAQGNAMFNGIVNTGSSMASSKSYYEAIAKGITGFGKTAWNTFTSDLQRGYAREAYNDTRDFTIDMFNYNLQNVQALPYNLTKVGAYNANNKIFPMVEFYTCKDVEKQALRDKMTYNGMTVMVIGKIEDYIDNSEKRFIKAQLIRLEIPDDSHVVNDIYNELNKGAYI